MINDVELLSLLIGYSYSLGSICAHLFPVELFFFLLLSYVSTMNIVLYYVIRNIVSFEEQKF